MSFNSRTMPPLAERAAGYTHNKRYSPLCGTSFQSNQSFPSHEVDVSAAKISSDSMEAIQMVPSSVSTSSSSWNERSCSNTSKHLPSRKLPHLESSTDVLTSPTTLAARPSAPCLPEMDHDSTNSDQITSPSMTRRTRHYHDNERAPPRFQHRHQNHNDASVCGSNASSAASCINSVAADTKTSNTVVTESTAHTSASAGVSTKSRSPFRGLRFNFRKKTNKTQPHHHSQQHQYCEREDVDNAADVLASAKASAAACLNQQPNYHNVHKLSSHSDTSSSDDSNKSSMCSEMSSDIHIDLVRAIDFSNDPHNCDKRMENNDQSSAINEDKKHAKNATTSSRNQGIGSGSFQTSFSGEGLSTLGCSVSSSAALSGEVLSPGQSLPPIMQNFNSNGAEDNPNGRSIFSFFGISSSKDEKPCTNHSSSSGHSTTHYSASPKDNNDSVASTTQPELSSSTKMRSITLMNSSSNADEQSILLSKISQQGVTLANSALEKKDNISKGGDTKKYGCGGGVQLAELVRCGLFDCRHNASKKSRSVDSCDRDSDNNTSTTLFFSKAPSFSPIECGKGITLSRLICSEKNIRIDPEDQALLNQLQRMTSWNTSMTGNTDFSLDSDTFSDASTEIEYGRAKEVVPASENGKQKPHKKYHKQDIKRKGNKKKTRVRFEYPPVSSFHERPKTQPEEIEKLYFTEQELDIIYDDECSTTAMDDVEVLAFSSLSLAKEEMKRRQEESHSQDSAKEGNVEASEGIEEYDSAEEVSDGSSAYSCDDYDVSDRNSDIDEHGKRIKEREKEITSSNSNSNDHNIDKCTTSTVTNDVLFDSVFAQPSASWRDIPHTPTTELHHNFPFASPRLMSSRRENGRSVPRRSRRRGQNTTVSSSAALPTDSRKNVLAVSSAALPTGHGTKKEDTTMNEKELSTKEVQIYFRQRSIPAVVSNKGSG